MEQPKYWIVKLGKLYYARGLSQLSQEYPEAASFEMTNEEMVAWPFKHVEIAVIIAEEIGGVVVDQEGDIEAFISHAQRNRDYLVCQSKYKEARTPKFKRSIIKRNR